MLRSAAVLPAALVALALPIASSMAQPTEAPVGMARRAWVDSARAAWSGEGQRPLTTTVWYPADVARATDTVRIGPPADPLFVVGTFARDAPIRADARRRPLVVLSHGTGGSALQLGWLARGLAARGYIVAAPDHHGNTGAEPSTDPRGFTLWWERARDLSVVIDRVLADSALAPHVDPARIAAVGFSIGGYTVTALAGARTDLAAFSAHCASAERDASCESPPERPTAAAEFEVLARSDSATRAALARSGAPHGDARVRAVVAMAPAVGHAFPAASLREVRVPYLAIAARADSLAPAAANAEWIVRHVPGARLELLPGPVGHYAFLSECAPRGMRVLPLLCRDAPGVDRAEVHRAATDLVAAFLAHAGVAPDPIGRRR